MRKELVREEIPSVLGCLRAFSIASPLSVTAAKRVAEEQANWLLSTFDITEPPVPVEMVTELPRITVIGDPHIRASGFSYWADQSWILVVNNGESPQRQRFTIMHEFKHIVDHGRPGPHSEHWWEVWRDPKEQVADFFSGCVLVPRDLLKAAWMSGTRQPITLARLFDVSVSAMITRMGQVGLHGSGRHGDQYDNRYSR